MIYCNLYGEPTYDDNILNSFILTEDNLEKLANEIASILTWDNTLFFNVQIPSECSQYDIIVSNVYYNQGRHQRGIVLGDLIIGIVGSGCHGFKCANKNETTCSYYFEKLGVGSDMLTNLFNKIRDKVGGEINDRS